MSLVFLLSLLFYLSKKVNMQYSLYCDQVKCLEWSISATDWIVFDYITKAVTWCDHKEIDWQVYRKINTSKLLKDMPVICRTKKWFNNVIRRLLDSWVIEYKLINKNTPYYKVTEKWSSWNKKSLGCEQDDTPPANKTTQGGANKTTYNPSTNNTSTKIISKKNFEEIWKAYPHDKKTHKERTKKRYNKSEYDYEVVLEEIKLLKRKIATGKQDWQYLPAMERRMRDFVPTNKTVKKQFLKQTMIELQWTDQREEFNDDWGKEVLKPIWDEMKKQERQQTIKSLSGN